MTDDPAPTAARRRDPDAQTSELELIRYVRSLGATAEDVAATSNLGELALDLSLRPRGPLPLREVARTPASIGRRRCAS